MNKTVVCFCIAAIISSCNSNQKSGIKSLPDYTIIGEHAGDPPKQGQFLKLHVKQVYGDSVLSDTRVHMPQYLPYDSAEMTKESYKIFSHVHVGDSIIFKVSSDSAFKSNPPPFAKKGQWLVTYVKVIAIFSNADLARVDMHEEEVARGYAPKSEPKVPPQQEQGFQGNY